MRILKNNHLEIFIDDNTKYTGTRFDHTLLISQVILDNEHTFLGIEKTPAGTGTGGVGLYSGWLWKKEIRRNGKYPMPGIGWLHIPENEEYSIRKNYDYDPALINIEKETCSEIIIESIMPDFCRVMKRATINKSELTIETSLYNDYHEPFVIEEYCHNFIMIDNHVIDHNYSVHFPCIPTIEMVRGSIELSDKYYSPVGFEKKIGTIALSMKEHIPDSVEVKNGICSVKISESSMPGRIYHWISEAAICPEAYQDMSIFPGDIGKFSRTYSFSLEST